MGVVDSDTLFKLHRQRIRCVVPEAEVHLTGSASVSDLDADDVDLVALVEDVAGSAARLRSIYPPLYEEQWSEDWAAFRELGPPQVDIVLTRRGSEWDARHRLAWDLLRQDRKLLAEYAALKAIPTRYPERKAEFFERITARPPSKPV